MKQDNLYENLLAQAKKLLAHTRQGSFKIFEGITVSLEKGGATHR